MSRQYIYCKKGHHKIPLDKVDFTKKCCKSLLVDTTLICSEGEGLDRNFDESFRWVSLKPYPKGSATRKTTS